MFGAIWGIAGVSLLLGSAVFRLTPIAIAALGYDLGWHHWLSIVTVVVFMSYAEGYKGFHQRFSPRVAARARYLREHPDWVHSLLGPFFCMGYFHASRTRKITSISLTLGIILLIIMVRLLPQPWRGIVDAGVVIGLLWGIVSLLVFAFLAFSSKDFAYSPEVPEETGKS